MGLTYLGGVDGWYALESADQRLDVVAYAMARNAIQTEAYEAARKAAETPKSHGDPWKDAVAAQLAQKDMKREMLAQAGDDPARRARTEAWLRKHG